jgi:3-oxoacyl-ACP reductase-like protein
MASSKKGSSSALFASMQKVNQTREEISTAQAAPAPAPAPEPVAPVPVQEAAPAPAAKPAKETTPKQNKMVGDTEEICRQTYYYSYEEMAAIKTIGFLEDRANSEVVRELIDFALEQKYPGILTRNDVVKKAENLRDKVRKRQSIGEDD